jgi:hypothetical protein
VSFVQAIDLADILESKNSTDGSYLYKERLRKLSPRKGRTVSSGQQDRPPARQQ